MSLEVIVHDASLCGQVYPRRGLRIVRSNSQISLSDLASRIRIAALSVEDSRVCALRSSADVLTIAAHGVRVIHDPSYDTALEIGSEYLRFDNAREFGRGFAQVFADRIRVLGCGVARTDQGKQLCRQLASGAGTPVYASSSTQLYSRQGRVLWPFDSDEYANWINFGAWEGPVFRFDPDGSPGRQVFAGPAPRGAAPGGRAPRDDRCDR